MKIKNFALMVSLCLPVVLFAQNNDLRTSVQKIMTDYESRYDGLAEDAVYWVIVIKGEGPGTSSDKTYWLPEGWGTFFEDFSDSGYGFTLRAASYTPGQKGFSTIVASYDLIWSSSRLIRCAKWSEDCVKEG